MMPGVFHLENALEKITPLGLNIPLRCHRPLRFVLPETLVQRTEQQIRERVLRLFWRKKLLSKEEFSSMLAWRYSGFSLHAQVRVHAEDRTGMERLIRYCARPAFSSEQLRWVKPGKLLSYTPPKPDSKGQGTLLLNPMQLIDRIVKFIPPFRSHRNHYHGVLAPNSPLRKEIVALAGQPLFHHQSTQRDVLSALDKVKKPVIQADSQWAEMIARIYEVNPLECPKCGDEMKLIAFITEPLIIRRILLYIGENPDPPIFASARDPPQMELDFDPTPKEVYLEDIDLLITLEEPESPFSEMIDPSFTDTNPGCNFADAIDGPFIEEAFIEPEFDYNQVVEYEEVFTEPEFICD